MPTVTTTLPKPVTPRSQELVVPLEPQRRISFRWQLLMPFLLGLVLLVAVDLLLRFEPLDHFFNRQHGRDMLIKSEQLNSPGVKNVDTLFIGSSRTLTGFATPIFNQNKQLGHAYNLGLAASDFTIYRLLLQDFIRKQGKPRLVLLELSEFQFGHGNLSPNSINLMHNLVARQPDMLFELLKNPELTAKDKEKLIHGSISRIHRYRNTLDVRRLAKVIVRPAPEEPIDETGWMQAEKQRSYLAKPNPKALLIASISRYSDLMRGHLPSDTPSIVQFLDYCQKQKIPVVLVTWPLHPEYQKQVAASEHAPRVAQMREQIIQKYKLPYIDLNKNINSFAAAHYFIDVDHLGREGAIYYTQQLQKQLADSAEVL